MASYYIFLSLHILGATVWAGGHLVLAVTILPDALRQHRAATVSEFEQRFERIGLPALAVQIVTGLWLAERLLGSPDHWFEGNPVARTVQVKLGLLAVTVGLAVHASLLGASQIPRRSRGTAIARTTTNPTAASTWLTTKLTASVIAPERRMAEH